MDFNPSSYLLALEKLVTDEGVTVSYDTRLCALHRDAGRVTHLIVENKSGRQAIACGTVVDATGDADVCHLAGEETESLDTNVLCGWFYRLHEDGLHLDQLSNRYSPYAVAEGSTDPLFRGDDAEQVTAHILETRKLIREKLDRLRAEDPDSDIQIVTPPTIPCFRMTRRLVGTLSLGEQHMHRWFDDAVGLTGDWRKRGPVYALPFRSLQGVRTRNLLAAGRCFSADTTVWDATRAIPTCAVTGEAVGAASALAVKHSDGDVHTLSVPALQKHLREQGVLLDPGHIEPLPEDTGNR